MSLDSSPSNPSAHAAFKWTPQSVEQQQRFVDDQQSWLNVYLRRSGEHAPKVTYMRLHLKGVRAQVAYHLGESNEDDLQAAELDLFQQSLSGLLSAAGSLCEDQLSLASGDDFSDVDISVDLAKRDFDRIAPFLEERLDANDVNVWLYKNRQRAFRFVLASFAFVRQVLGFYCLRRDDLVLLAQDVLGSCSGLCETFIEESRVEEIGVSRYHLHELEARLFVRQEQWQKAAEAYRGVTRRLIADGGFYTALPLLSEQFRCGLEHIGSVCRTEGVSSDSRKDLCRELVEEVGGSIEQYKGVDSVSAESVFELSLHGLWVRLEYVQALKDRPDELGSFQEQAEELKACMEDLRQQLTAWSPSSETTRLCESRLLSLEAPGYLLLAASARLDGELDQEREYKQQALQCFMGLSSNSVSHRLRRARLSVELASTDAERQKAVNLFHGFVLGPLEAGEHQTFGLADALMLELELEQKGDQQAERGDRLVDLLLDLMQPKSSRDAVVRGGDDNLSFFLWEFASAESGLSAQPYQAFRRLPRALILTAFANVECKSRFLPLAQNLLLTRHFSLPEVLEHLQLLAQLQAEEGELSFFRGDWADVTFIDDDKKEPFLERCLEYFFQYADVLHQELCAHPALGSDRLSQFCYQLAGVCHLIENLIRSLCSASEDRLERQSLNTFHAFEVRLALLEAEVGFFVTTIRGPAYNGTSVCEPLSHGYWRLHGLSGDPEVDQVAHQELFCRLAECGEDAFRWFGIPNQNAGRDSKYIPTGSPFSPREQLMRAYEALPELSDVRRLRLIGLLLNRGQEDDQEKVRKQVRGFVQPEDGEDSPEAFRFAQRVVSEQLEAMGIPVSAEQDWVSLCQEDLPRLLKNKQKSREVSYGDLFDLQASVDAFALVAEGVGRWDVAAAARFFLVRWLLPSLFPQKSMVIAAEGLHLSRSLMNVDETSIYAQGYGSPEGVTFVSGLVAASRCLNGAKGSLFRLELGHDHPLMRRAYTLDMMIFQRKGEEEKLLGLCDWALVPNSKPLLEVLHMLEDLQSLRVNFPGGFVVGLLDRAVQELAQLQKTKTDLEADNKALGEENLGLRDQIRSLGSSDSDQPPAEEPVDEGGSEFSEPEEG